MDHCRDSIDCTFSQNSELCYQIIDCSNCYKLFFSHQCESCSDSALLYDCRNCQDCFGCVGLRNKSYNIFNKQYTKQEYFKKLKQLNIESYKSLIQNKEKLNKLKLNFPHRYAYNIKAVNVLGDRLRNVKNCFYCFDTHQTEDGKYILVGVDYGRDSYDMSFFGKQAELCYEGTSVTGNKNLFSILTTSCHNLQYCLNCRDSSYLFGCIGLRNKQYCIFNKQYSKEEYEELIPKIIEHMNQMSYKDKKGREYKYGEFFSSELSPFAYNETIIQEYFPLTKEQTIEQGYKWKDPDTKNYKIQIPNDKLPDHIKDVGDDIINETIQCAHADFSVNSRNNPRLSASCNEQLHHRL